MSSVYSVFESTVAALISDSFCLAGSSRNSSKHLAARASGLICQPAVLSDNFAFVWCKLCFSCKVCFQKSQKPSLLFDFERCDDISGHVFVCYRAHQDLLALLALLGLRA